MRLLVKLCHRQEDAQRLYDDGKCYDMLPVINPYKKSDMRTLDVFRIHLQQQDIPFMVEEGKRMCQDYVERDNIKLWKEKYV